MQRDGDASVEEILESIKKVIARDNSESAAPKRVERPVPAEAPVDEIEEDVFDLAEAEEMIEMDDSEDTGAAEPQSEDESLVTSHSRASMRESLAALAMLAEPPARPQIVRSGETSLEGLVREMLRPMLSEWLEENLPGMVERMVAEEISRIAGKKR